jgi:hypothetical protein
MYPPINNLEPKIASLMKSLDRDTSLLLELELN